MKRALLSALALSATVGLGTASAQTNGTVVYDNLLFPTPPNVPSQGFQCCATQEIGDHIRLEADTPRRAGYVTVLMSSWSLHSTYPDMPGDGYTHPITLNIYADAVAAAAHAPMTSVTQTFLIPWRPEADSTCTTPTAWRHTNGNCYNGFAFTISFDLRSLNLLLPDEFIFGVAYNTNTWGYEPRYAGGPYESLNVGLANVGGTGVAATVGTDLYPDVVYWNTSHAPFYTDGGTAGVGILRPDTGWTGYPISIQFTTFAFPTTKESCKNGAWQNLVRPDFTAFKNQGACVSFMTGQ